LVLVANIDDLAIESPASFDGQHLIFSRYDRTGNGKELVFFNPRTSKVEATFDGLGTSYSHYLFSNKDYVITRDSSYGPVHRLLIFSRSTGKLIKELNLDRRITGAFIKNGKLYVTQNNSEYQIYFGGTGLIYDLESTSLLKSAPLIGSSTVVLNGDDVLVLGYQAKAYDLDFNEVGSFTIPPRKPDKQSICELGPVKLAGGKLVVVANCGDILVYDLVTRSLERTIPSFDPAFFLSLDISGNLIFAAPSAAQDGQLPHKARIFDLHTGQEKAIIDVAGYFLSVADDLIITVPEYRRIKTSRVAIYRFDRTRLLAQDTQLKKLNTAHKQAKLMADENHDTYRAVDNLDDAGLPGVLARGEMDNPALQPIVEDYVRWLGETFDRYAEAIPLVEHLKAKQPNDARWALLVSDLFHKQYVISGDKLALDKAVSAYKEYQQVFGRAPQIASRDFGPARKVINSSDVKEISIVRGDLPHSIYFHEGKAYIGVYDCISWMKIGDIPGVRLEVYDPIDFKLFHSIRVAGCDDEYQDNIEQIRFSKNQILLDIGYRYESEDRPNFVVLDKTTLKVLATMHVKNKPEQSPSVRYGFPIEAGNAKYEIKNIGQLRVKSRKDGREWDMKLPAIDQGQPYLLGDPERIFIASGSHFVLYDLNSDISLTLARVKSGKNNLPVVTTYQNLAFVGIGHDLLILDCVRKRIAHFERNFISQGFEDNGHGLDTNRIAMLMVVGDRLIARTFYGAHSRILDLKALKNSLGIVETGPQPTNESDSSVALIATPANRGVQEIPLAEDIDLSQRSIPPKK
jgi:hypothetical protein